MNNQKTTWGRKKPKKVPLTMKSKIKLLIAPQFEN
jgi:hypothetical protein